MTQPANRPDPAPDTLGTFRRENQDLLSESLVKVLQLAQQLKRLKFGQLTVAAEGPKVPANASQHRAVSHARAGEMIEQLEREVRQLLAKAEQADRTPLPDGLSIPEEITPRQERQAALARARAEIEARAHARYPAQLAEHKARLAERAAKEEHGEKARGQPPPAPSPEPGAQDQYHFTDPESRIMKAGHGPPFEPSDNAQAAVEVERRLIVGERVSTAPNDQPQLAPTRAAIPVEAGPLAAALVDSGYFSEAALTPIERPPGALQPAPWFRRRLRKPGITGAWPSGKNAPNPEPPPPERA